MLTLTAGLIAVTMLVAGPAAADLMEPSSQTVCGWTKDRSGYTCHHREVRDVYVTTAGTEPPAAPPTGAGATAWVAVVNQSSWGASSTPTPNEWRENATNVHVVASADAAGMRLAANWQAQYSEYESAQPDKSRENKSVKVFMPGASLNGIRLVPSELPAREVTYTRLTQGDTHTCGVKVSGVAERDGIDCPSPEDLLDDAGWLVDTYESLLFPSGFAP